MLLGKSKEIIMARIVGKKIAWEASVSTDVVSYKLYIVNEGETISYETPGVLIAAPVTEYALPGEFTMVEGSYVAAVTSIDSAGNESDLSESITFPLDIAAPVAPTGVRIVG
jgi:hypothetical protein